MIIVVMISLITLESIHFLDQQILLVKWIGRLKQQGEEALVIENRLIEQEALLLKSPDRFLEKASFFVPDHLEFGCKKGVWIVEVSMPPFQSFVAIRP